MGKIVVSIILVIALIAGILFTVDILNPEYGFFAKVEAGHVGVVDRFGKVKESALEPGFHTVGYFEKVIPIDARVQKYTTSLEAFSADIQQVILLTTVNFEINAEKAGVLYKTIGMNYVDKLILPRLMENTKTVIGGYTAETLVTNREEISTKVVDRMQKDMEGYGIKVTVISIENIDFTDAFEAAVEAKQVATQEKQKAITDQEKQTIEAREAATRKKLATDAEAYQIITKAEAEAEANKKIAESITDDLIKYVEANGWDGKLPAMYMSSEGALPIISSSFDPFEDEDDPYQK